jgi:hypothetical protein
MNEKIFEQKLLKNLKNNKVVIEKKVFTEEESEKINDTIKKATLFRKIETEIKKLHLEIKDIEKIFYALAFGDFCFLSKRLQKKYNEIKDIEKKQ